MNVRHRNLHTSVQRHNYTVIIFIIQAIGAHHPNPANRQRRSLADRVGHCVEQKSQVGDRAEVVGALDDQERGGVQGHRAAVVGRFWELSRR